MSERDGEAGDWSAPRPERTPRPTYWPAALAAGIVLLAYGLIFSGWFVALGVGLAALALGGWIGELRHERR